MKHSFSASILSPGFGRGEIIRRRGLNTPKTKGSASSTDPTQMGAIPGTRALARLGRLEAGRTLKLDIRQTGQLRISAGLAWATLSHDPRDYWLPGGTDLKVESGQCLVLSAEGRQDLRWALVPVRPGVLGAAAPDSAAFDDAALGTRFLGAAAFEVAALGAPGRFSALGLAALGLAGLRRAASMARRAHGAIRRVLSMASLGTVQ